MDAVKWIALVVVVLVVLALLVALLGRRKRAQRAQLADQHRAEARQEMEQLSDHRLAAQDAEHRAQVARAQAERAESEAEQAKLAEHTQAARAEDRVRTADKLDPRVNHKADDYEPGFDRAAPAEGAASDRTVDPETGHPR
jgi:FtsZ-interacting cell division protein ZipA